MLVTAATNPEEAYTLLNEIVGIGDFPMQLPTT